jgi:quinol monooxygenase YgiN
MLAASNDLVKHDRKSVVPMILYAEFTAKPGSEAEVGRLISGLAEDVRREPGNTEFTGLQGTRQSAQVLRLRAVS